MLPLGPPDGAGSPYASASAFAALRRAARGARRARVTPDELEAFARAQRVLDRATGPRFAGAGAIADQVRFDREWGALRRYARRARRAADRRRPDLRRRAAAPTTRRTPSSSSDGVVAGAPPDGLSAGRPALGQPALRLGRDARATGYRWWIERLRRTFELFDLTRVDHFRGFVAVLGRARGRTRRRARGTGGAARARELFDAAERELGAAAAGRRGPRRDHPPVERAARRARAARAWS